MHQFKRRTLAMGAIICAGMVSHAWGEAAVSPVPASIQPAAIAKAGLDATTDSEPAAKRIETAQAPPAESGEDSNNSAAIGSITKVKGKAVVVRENGEVEAAIGERLFEADTVRTSEDGHVGIVLRDDSMLALGVSSELKLKDYAFEPIEKDYSLVTQLVKGTFSYVSGVIAKLSPDSVKLETPVGIVAVRGTKLFVWIDPSNAAKQSIREETE